MNKWQRFWGHLRTVHKHRKMVRKLCFKCGLYWQGLTHDLSKYSHTEFWNGVKYFTGTASPHIGERKVKGYSDAWLHHHNRNKHHAEYWVDIVDGKSAPIEMPLKYLAEMICDRVAASMIYLGDKYTDSAPFDYFKSHLDENQFHEDTKRELVDWLATIELYGLEKALKQLKMELQMEKEYEKYVRS
jgi:hypothetical protein